MTVDNPAKLFAQMHDHKCYQEHFNLPAALIFVRSVKF